MSGDFRTLSDESISSANEINNRLIEKSLAMRCSSYLSQIKAQLLTNTIYEIDSSKKVLFNMNTQLQQEILERRRIEEKLRKAKHEAEEATKLKDKFVALVSHDLNNPLAIITGYLSLLRLSSHFDEHEKNLLAKSLSACNAMSLLVNRILNISRFASGAISINYSEVDASKLVSNVINSFSEAAREKGIKITNSLPGSCLHVDEDLFKEVMNNLVSNSIKFCNQGDEIHIYPVEGANTIAISDTGVGIQTDKLAKLFLYEEKTTTTGTAGETGTGLGLPLSQDIIRAHGGELRVESTPGKGTTFYIEFPDRQPHDIVAGKNNITPG